MNNLIELGKIAGIGGISLGIIFLLYRQIFAKNNFSNLTPEHGYNILRLSIILLFIIGIVGMLLWTLPPLLLDVNKKEKEKENNKNTEAASNKVTIDSEYCVKSKSQATAFIKELNDCLKRTVDERKAFNLKYWLKECKAISLYNCHSIDTTYIKNVFTSTEKELKLCTN